MKCPNDNTSLAMTDRQGIEIDYCPECRGIWLDKGELDKLIERSSIQDNPAPSYVDKRDDRDYSSDRNYRKKKKKEGFLGDLFDF